MRVIGRELTQQNVVLVSNTIQSSEDGSGTLYESISGRLLDPVENFSTATNSADQLSWSPSGLLLYMLVNQTPSSVSSLANVPGQSETMRGMRGQTLIPRQEEETSYITLFQSLA